MKTVVVLSDTHGHRAAIEKLFPLFAENDYVIHLGDGNRDMAQAYAAFPGKTFVCRNYDGSDLPLILRHLLSLVKVLVFQFGKMTQDS